MLWEACVRYDDNLLMYVLCFIDDRRDVSRYGEDNRGYGGSQGGGRGRGGYDKDGRGPMTVSR